MDFDQTAVAQVDWVQERNVRAALTHLLQLELRRLHSRRLSAQARELERRLGLFQRLLKLRLGGHAAADGRLERARHAHRSRVAVANHAAAPKSILIDFQQLLLDQRRQFELIEQQRQILFAGQRETKRVFIVAVTGTLPLAPALAAGRIARNLVADPIMLVAGNDAGGIAGGRIDREARFADVLALDGNFRRLVMLVELAAGDQLIDLRLQGSRQALQNALPIRGVFALVRSPIDDDGGHAANS